MNQPFDFIEPDSFVIENAEKCRRRIAKGKKNLSTMAEDAERDGNIEDSISIRRYISVLSHLDGSIKELMKGGRFSDELTICCWFASTLLQPASIKRNTLSELPVSAMRTMERNFNQYPPISNKRH